MTSTSYGSLTRRLDLVWVAARSLIGRLRDFRKNSGVGDESRTPWAGDDVGSTLLAPEVGQRPSSSRGLRAGFVVRTPDGGITATEQLARRGESKLQVALLAEALTLLDPVDCRLIELRLDGEAYESIARVLGLSPGAAGPRYALAVDRLVERLDWVATEERRGVSPPERAVLGQARFFGRSAREIARRLRLHGEVVERWIRLANPSTPSAHGAPP